MKTLISPKYFFYVFFLTIIITLTGCQSTSEKFVENQQLTQQQNEQFLIAKTAIEKLEQEFKEADEQNISLFAPNIVDKFKDKKADAEDKFDVIRFAPHKATESKTNRILFDISKARQYLKQAFLIKDSAEQLLSESFSKIKRLKILKADKLYAKEFKKSQQKIAALIVLITEGNQAKALEQQAKVLPLLNSIEIKVVKDTELKELRGLLSTLKKSKTNKIAPISYQKAIGLSQTAESVISTNPRDTVEIKKSVSIAIFEAKHTQNIAIAARNLIAIDKDDYEKYILNFENKLNSVSDALQGIDLRDQVISEQTTSLVLQGKRLNSQLAQQAQKIVELEILLTNKNKLIKTASKDKDSYATIIQNKLLSKSKQITQQTAQLNTLTQTKLSLEQQIITANTKIALSLQKLEQTTYQHDLILAKNELSVAKKQLEFDKKIQSLKAALTKIKADNLAKNKKITLLTKKIADLNDDKTQAIQKITSQKQIQEKEVNK